MSLLLVFVVFIVLGVLSLIVYSEHPVSVGFWFAFYSMMVSVWLGLEVSSYVSYLMFFVYVGALLVMFCMVISLAPNPVFRVVPFVSLFPFLGSSVLLDGVFFIGKGVGSESVIGDLYSGLGIYDGFGWGVVLVWLSLVLLLGMISVVSMCKWSSGPLVRFSYKSFGLSG